MDGAADRSGSKYYPLTLRERECTGGRAHAQGRSLRPTVPKPPPPPHSPPCRAARTGLGACRLPAFIRR
jgi:hypothetical protein